MKIIINNFEIDTNIFLRGLWIWENYSEVIIWPVMKINLKNRHEDNILILETLYIICDII